MRNVVICERTWCPFNGKKKRCKLKEVKIYNNGKCEQAELEV